MAIDVHHLHCGDVVEVECDNHLLAAYQKVGQILERLIVIIIRWMRWGITHSVLQQLLHGSCLDKWPDIKIELALSTNHDEKLSQENDHYV